MWALFLRKGKDYIQAKGPKKLEAYFQFQWHEAARSISPPLDGMLVHRRVTPSINITSMHTYVEGGTVRVKCLTQEHNTESAWRARI